METSEIREDKQVTHFTREDQPLPAPGSLFHESDFGYQERSSFDAWRASMQMEIDSSSSSSSFFPQVKVDPVKRSSIFSERVYRQSVAKVPRTSLVINISSSVLIPPCDAGQVLKILTTRSKEELKNLWTMNLIAGCVGINNLTISQISAAIHS